jgi:hypothetical protein
MPLGEIASEVLGGLLRLVAQIFLEVVVEILIKGPGYVVCRFFSKNADPDGVSVIVTGILFWSLSGSVGYVLFKHISA